MHVSATEAKNRVGPMLDHCRRTPLAIESAGRRGVRLAPAQCDTPFAASKPWTKKADPGRDSCVNGKDGVDGRDRQFETCGIRNPEFRSW